MSGCSEMGRRYQDREFGAGLCETLEKENSVDMDLVRCLNLVRARGAMDICLSKFTFT